MYPFTSSSCLCRKRGNVNAAPPASAPAREVGKERKGERKKDGRRSVVRGEKKNRQKTFFSPASASLFVFSRRFSFRMRGLRAAVEAALLGIVASSPSSLTRIRKGGTAGSRRGDELIIRRWRSRHRRRDMSKSSSELTPSRPQPPKAASRAEVATSRGFLDTARVLITEDGRPRVVGR